MWRPNCGTSCGIAAAIWRCREVPDVRCRLATADLTVETIGETLLGGSQEFIIGILGFDHLWVGLIQALAGRSRKSWGLFPHFRVLFYDFKLLRLCGPRKMPQACANWKHCVWSRMSQQDQVTMASSFLSGCLRSFGWRTQWHLGKALGGNRKLS